MAYPRFRRARAHKDVTRTAGDLVLNSTSWADVNTGLDLTLTAQVGDVVVAGVSLFWNSEAVYGYLDVASIVSGTPAYYWAGAGGASDIGVPGWVGVSGVEDGRCGVHRRTLIADDLASGVLTCRLRYRTSAASNKTLYANANRPFQFWIENIGPVAPH